MLGGRAAISRLCTTRIDGGGLMRLFVYIWFNRRVRYFGCGDWFMLMVKAAK